MSEPPLRLDYPCDLRPRELEELASRVTTKGRTVRRRRRALTATGALAVGIVAIVGVSAHVQQRDHSPTSILAVAQPANGSPQAISAATQQLAKPQRVQGLASTAGVFTQTSQAKPVFFVGDTGAGAEQQTVYDSSTGAKLRTLGFPSQRQGVLSGDRTTLYLPIGDCEGYDAIDIATGKVSPAWGGLTGLRGALPSPDGTQLVYDTCAQNGGTTTLILRNLTTGTMTTSTIAGNLYPESWSPDQTRIAVSNRPDKGGGSLLLLDAGTLRIQGSPILDASSRCALASPHLLNHTSFIAVEDCSGGSVNLVKLTVDGAGPARLIGITGVYSDPSGVGSPLSMLSLDSTHEHAVVQISRSMSLPADQNGLVFFVDAAGSTESTVTNTYQVQW